MSAASPLSGGRSRILELKIIDPKTGKIIPVGEIGEICARGYCVMKCYYNNPSATHATLDKDHWNHTGDLATMDEEGYFKIVGRLKDMVIRGGENIYPREIEEFLHHHEKISDVYVVGVPDIKYGEELCAWVKMKQGQTMTEQEVKDFCKGKIAHFKIPRYVVFVNDFPINISGKIQKYPDAGRVHKETRARRGGKHQDRVKETGGIFTFFSRSPVGLGWF